MNLAELFILVRPVSFRMIKRHHIKVVVLGNVSPSLKVYALLEDLFGDEVEIILCVPSPDSFPLFSRIYIEGVENHHQAGRATCLRLCLCNKLLGEREVTLHAAVNQGFFEDGLSCV